MKKILCPYCMQRLLDAEAEGEIEIKCTRCKQVVKLKLNKESA